MRRLLAFLHPLLGRAPLIIEPHHHPTEQAQIRDDKAPLAETTRPWVLNLSDDPSRLGPAPRLVREALVADQWLAAGPSRGPEQDLGNLPLQGLVGWNADRIHHAALLECFVDLRFGKGRVRPESNFLALPPVDARSPATAARPSLRRCARCPVAASPPGSPSDH